MAAEPAGRRGLAEVVWARCPAVRRSGAPEGAGPASRAAATTLRPSGRQEDDALRSDRGPAVSIAGCRLAFWSVSSELGDQTVAPPPCCPLVGRAWSRLSRRCLRQGRLPRTPLPRSTAERGRRVLSSPSPALPVSALRSGGSQPLGGVKTEGGQPCPRTSLGAAFCSAAESAESAGRLAQGRCVCAGRLPLSSLCPSAVPPRSPGQPPAQIRDLLPPPGDDIAGRGRGPPP